MSKLTGIGLFMILLSYTFQFVGQYNIDEKRRMEVSKQNTMILSLWFIEYERYVKDPTRNNPNSERYSSGDFSHSVAIDWDEILDISAKIRDMDEQSSFLVKNSQYLFMMLFIVGNVLVIAPYFTKKKC